MLITSHVRPDADALGSSLALAHGLTLSGVVAVVYNRDGVPAELEFLPGSDAVVSDVSGTIGSFDLVVLVDCGDRGRIGDEFPWEGFSGATLCIDHHRSFDPDVADLVFRDESAAASAEMVYHLLAELEVPLTTAAATCMYAALMADTGSFRYASTSVTSMEIASTLLRAGVETWAVASALYESNPLARTKLLARVLDTLEVRGSVATLSATPEMIASVGADEGMVDGFVNHARAIRGVEVAAMITWPSPPECRVSLRSRGRVDVSAIAERFGGGGHVNAAAFSYAGTIEALRSELLRATEDVSGESD